MSDTTTLATCDKGHDVRLTTRIIGHGHVVCWRCHGSKLSDAWHASEKAQKSSFDNLQKAHEATRKIHKEELIRKIRRQASFAQPAGGGVYYTNDFNGLDTLFPLYHTRKDYNGIA